MKIVKFVKWWWRNSQDSEKIVGLLVLTFLTLPGFIFAYGGFGVFVWAACVFFTIAACFILHVFWNIYKYVLGKYEDFCEAQDREAREIIRRLQGNGHY